MLRTLLTTTAIVVVMQTGALAADNTASDAMKPAPIFQKDDQYKRSVNELGYFQMVPGQILASTLIGKSVYNNSSDEAEAIGDINDIIISPDGTAEAVIIGVGGFLGLGEKEVAIDFNRVAWVKYDDDRRVVVDVTKEELDAAPAYDKVAMEAEATKTTKVAEGEPKKMDGTAEDKTTADAKVKDTSQAPVTTTENAMPDRESMKTVDIATVSADQLLDATVYGEDGEAIGEVSDVIVNDGGKIESFIVDVGGFLGINEKSVEVAAQNIDFRMDEDEDLVVFTPFTEEELKAQAAYSDKDKDGYGRMEATPRS